VLDRSGRNVTLTAAGRLLADYAEKVGALLREAERPRRTDRARHRTGSTGCFPERDA
jgi:DNA-binding transcriptional LysR family regulator